MHRLLPLVSFLLVFAPAARGADWPAWRGLRGDGVWRGVELPERFSASTVRERWRVPLGGGYSGIAVADGRVYTMDRPPGSRIERVLAFDASSGEKLWSYEHPADYGDMDHANGPRATPAVERGRVYTIGATGIIACLEAATGKIRWSVAAASRLDARQPIWGHAASCVVDGELLYLQVGARPGGTVVALERETGRERWRALDDRPGYSTPVLAEIDGRRQLVVWTADGVAGLDPDSGEVFWRHAFKTSNYDVAIISPALHGVRLFVSGYWDGASAVELEGKSTRVLWEARSPSCLMATPLVHGGHLYALDKRAGLLCLEWESGRLLWNDEGRLTPKGRNPHASIVWAGGAGSTAVALNSEGELVLARISPAGYEEHGRVRILDGGPSPVWAHPAFAGQDVFARSDSELVCVRIEAGG